RKRTLPSTKGVSGAARTSRAARRANLRACRLSWPAVIERLLALFREAGMPDAPPAARRARISALRRLTLFAKGNNDVRDWLHSRRVGGELCWNGINEVVRARFPGTTVRVRHEVWTRSDALLGAESTVPRELDGWSVPLAPHTPAAQFSNA